MPIEVHEIYIHPGESKIVKCIDNINQFLVGLGLGRSYFSTDHHKVERMAIHLQTSQPSSDEIQVNAVLVLNGGNGDQINEYVPNRVIIVAWTGFSSELTLANSVGIADGSTSPPIDLEGLNQSILQPVLSGFDLSFDDIHKIRKVSAGVGAESGGDVAYISGNASMSSDGASADQATVDGGLIASSMENPGFHLISTGEMKSGEQKEFQFPPGTQYCVPILVSFDVFFEDQAHELREFCVGFYEDAVTGPDDQGKVSLRAHTQLTSGGGDDADPDSSVTAILIGWSDPDPGGGRRGGKRNPRRP